MNELLRGGLAPLLEPQSAIVVGDTATGPAADLWRNLARGAETVAVHRSGKGDPHARIATSIGETRAAPDVCALAVGPGAIAAAAAEAVAHGARSLVVPGLGPEDGELGAEARAALTEIAVRAGIPLVGPNCMGVAIPGGPSAWIGAIPHEQLRAGGVGCVVHSGSIGEALVHAGPRFGLRAVISSGNETVRDSADWLAAFAEDPATRVAGLALEAIRRPAAFAEALARAARAELPVIVLVSGRSQASSRAALAHSGAVAGSARGVEALCAAHGAVFVHDVADWLEHLEAFGACRALPGRRLVALTNSGGEGAIVADAAEDAGLELPDLPGDLQAALTAGHPGLPPGNPIDYWAVAPAAELAPALARACAAHPGVDGLVLVAEQSLRYGPDEGAVARAAVDAAIAAAHDGAFAAVVSCAALDADPAALRAAGSAGVPVLKGPGAALRALAALARWAPRERVVPDAGAAPAAPELESAHGHLPELESRAVLARYGVAGPREARAASAAEAATAAAEIGCPVVVKRHGPAHREHAGGVALGCATPQAAAEAAARVGLPVVVCQELRGGIEVLCGLVRDPTAGPLLVCGVGGTLAEALAPLASAALAPLDEAGAEELVAACAPLARALDATARRAVAEVLVALGRLAAHRPEIAAIDVNPLRVHEGRATALDALIVLQT